MFEFFDYIWGFVDTIGSYIHGCFMRTLEMFDALIMMIELPMFLQGMLPSILGAGCTLTLLMFVMKFILQR